MRSFKCILLYLLVSAATVSHAGWSLDVSCEEKYEKVVIKGMKDAFALADAGLGALNDIRDFIFSQKDKSSPTPEQQAQIDLLHYLFSDARIFDANDMVFQKLADTFKSILAFRGDRNGEPTPRPPGPFIPANFVVVYCNYKRFEEHQDCDGNEKENKACDIDLWEVVDMDEDYLSCKAPYNADTTEAWTVNNNFYKFEKPAQVQLCEWYLQKSLNWPFKYLKHIIGAKAFLARVYEWNLAITGKHTMMDAAGLLGSTLLHELSHAIKKGSTSDLGEKADCYGWENCKKLSTRGGSATNADSYSQFALGAKFIKPGDGNKPQRPMKDGSIQVLPQEGSGKRQYYGEISNATHHTSEPTSLFHNNDNIPLPAIETIKSGDVPVVSPRNSKLDSGSLSFSSSTSTPSVYTPESTNTSTFTVPTELSEGGTNSETRSISLTSNSDSARPSSSSNTFHPLSPPQYKALKETKTTSSACTKKQTASVCVIALSMSSETGASTASTKTITTSCTTTTGCSAKDTASTITLSPQDGKDAPTVTPVYDHFLWDGNTEWYYLQQLILDELFSATWPIITWSASSTSSSSSSHSSAAHPAPTSKVNHGDLTCGSPATFPSDEDATLQKRTDQGNPEFWMSIGEAGQSGLVDGISTFCHFLATTKFKIDPTYPPRGSGIQFSYNEHVYDPIFFGILWRKADDCPVLDFVNDRDKAIGVCDTTSHSHHWWKQGGTFFRDCLEWQVYRDTWQKDSARIPTDDAYRPPRKCRKVEDCNCPLPDGDGKGMELCADGAEFSDLGWCTCKT